MRKRKKKDPPPLSPVVVDRGNLCCRLCKRVLGQKGVSPTGLPEKIKLHFDLFHSDHENVDSWIF